MNGSSVPHDGVSSPANCNTGSGQYINSVYKYTKTCQFGDDGNAQCNASCDAPNTMVGGQCIPYVDPCTGNKDQVSGWKKVWPSFDAYNADASKPKCTTSQNGCALDICGSDGSLQCGQSGTGEFACYGNGKYTGVSQDVSEGGGVDGCLGAECQTPKPTETDSSKQCTMPAMAGNTYTYTCTTEADSSQFADSNCAMGEVNGVTAIHCVKPDYVPETNSKQVVDNVTETTNPDGTKTQVTETTTTSTTCKAGDCKTSTTVTTTTKNTDADGNTTGEDSVCKGDKCDDPTTPQDESQEEEDAEEVERTASGDSCSDNLQCEGDAIDCAILRQQKAMRCSLDWDSQKGSVIAEASKAEYQLQEEEIDASGLFSGPSAARWLSSSCPADRHIYLKSTNSTVTYSWADACGVADVIGYFLVFGASLFFAVYVGRSFGGS